MLAPQQHTHSEIHIVGATQEGYWRQSTHTTWSHSRRTQPRKRQKAGSDVAYLTSTHLTWWCEHILCACHDNINFKRDAANFEFIRYQMTTSTSKPCEISCIHQRTCTFCALLRVDQQISYFYWCARLCIINYYKERKQLAKGWKHEDWKQLSSQNQLTMTTEQLGINDVGPLHIIAVLFFLAATVHCSVIFIRAGGSPEGDGLSVSVNPSPTLHHQSSRWCK
jgi:hypothetical protein